MDLSDKPYQQLLLVVWLKECSVKVSEHRPIDKVTQDSDKNSCFFTPSDLKDEVNPLFRQDSFQPVQVIVASLLPSFIFMRFFHVLSIVQFSLSTFYFVFKMKIHGVVDSQSV